MAIAKELAALLGGELTLTSELGQGSALTLTSELGQGSAFTLTIPRILTPTPPSTPIQPTC